MEELIEKLKDVGFNGYEAKVYIALLQYGNSTGYEVSKNSGIPQARAYDTLKALETKKIIISTGEKPLTYMPVDPSEILSRYQEKQEKSIEFLKNNLLNFSGDYVEPIINVRDRNIVKDNIIKLVSNAKKEILLEAWGDEFDKYKQYFIDAHNRGVDIKIVGYKNLDFDFGLVYQHSGGDSVEKMVGKCFILVVDENEALISIENDVKKVDAVCTKNKTLVFITKEMIIHDMFLIDIENTLGGVLPEIYGENIIKLREKLLGKDFRANL